MRALGPGFIFKRNPVPSHPPSKLNLKSPPPLENFRDIPVVNKGPYDLEPSMEHK